MHAKSGGAPARSAQGRARNEKVVGSIPTGGSVVQTPSQQAICDRLGGVSCVLCPLALIRCTPAPRALIQFVQRTFTKQR
jgi:hypothetical protein